MFSTAYHLERTRGIRIRFKQHILFPLCTRSPDPCQCAVCLVEDARMIDGARLIDGACVIGGACLIDGACLLWCSLATGGV